MRQATIIAPDGLAASLPAFFPSTGTVKAKGGTLTPGSEGTFSAVSGLSDLPCAVAPDRTQHAISGDFMATGRAWIAALNARYATLHAATVALQFTVDGVTYGAVVDGDSQGDYTRLKLTLDIV
jgi:hypothetical protein